MADWSSEINRSIDAQLADSRDKDILFFRVKEFQRNVERVDEFSASCPVCQKEKIDIAEVAKSIGEAVNSPGKKRREYDRLIDRLSKHMRKEHGFFTPYYFSYVYALYGTIAGVILGLILSQLVPGYKIELFAVGVSIGLVVSYFIGTLKDKKVRDEHKLM